MADPSNSRSDLASAEIHWKAADALRNLHPDLKADYILANPPFNISDGSGSRLSRDHFARGRSVA